MNSLSSAGVIFGILLYLSKFLRPHFSENDDALFVLGFLPNLGLAFAMPFIYVANRVRLNKPLKHLLIVCLVTVILMIGNELRDKYQSGRVFDWFDIFASLVGVSFAFLIIRLAFQRPMMRQVTNDGIGRETRMPDTKGN